MQKMTKYETFVVLKNYTLKNKEKNKINKLSKAKYIEI